ncbi:hypothetical protein HRbin27_01915 [bacterium HR27]|nr:hypothetical protein HRbin27_01915 [bacterium HR27]
MPRQLARRCILDLERLHQEFPRPLRCTFHRDDEDEPSRTHPGECRTALSRIAVLDLPGRSPLRLLSVHSLEPQLDHTPRPITGQQRQRDARRGRCDGQIATLRVQPEVERIEVDPPQAFRNVPAEHARGIERKDDTTRYLARLSWHHTRPGRRPDGYQCLAAGKPGQMLERRGKRVRAPTGEIAHDERACDRIPVHDDAPLG